MLTTFNFPRSVFTTTLVPICALLYFTLFPESSVATFFAPARLVHPRLDGSFLAGIWFVVCLLHALEALYVFSLVRKHAGNFSTGVRCWDPLHSILFFILLPVIDIIGILQAGYILGTLAFGFPFLVDLRRRIQAARIDSVMKIQ